MKFHHLLDLIVDEGAVTTVWLTLRTVVCTSQMGEQTPQRPEPMEWRRWNIPRDTTTDDEKHRHTRRSARWSDVSKMNSRFTQSTKIIFQCFLLLQYHYLNHKQQLHHHQQHDHGTPSKPLSSGWTDVPLRHQSCGQMDIQYVTTHLTKLYLFTMHWPLGRYQQQSPLFFRQSTSKYLGNRWTIQRAHGASCRNVCGSRANASFRSAISDGLEDCDWNLSAETNCMRGNSKMICSSSFQVCFDRLSEEEDVSSLHPFYWASIDRFLRRIFSICNRYSNIWLYLIIRLPIGHRWRRKGTSSSHQSRSASRSPHFPWSRTDHFADVSPEYHFSRSSSPSIVQSASCRSEWNVRCCCSFVTEFFSWWWLLTLM